jgi:AraC-like DNA-binding protein
MLERTDRVLPPRISQTRASARNDGLRPGGPELFDALADVLRSVRLTGGVFLDAHFTAPWCVSAQLSARACEPFLANPVQLIAYHYVLEGRLFLCFEDDRPIEVGAGEIVLLPRNDNHMLASGLGLDPVRADTLMQPSAEGGLARIRHGGGGAPAHLICGFLGSGDVHNPVISTLPRALKLDVREAASRDWIEASMRYAAHELAEGRLGSSGMLSRLSELLFVEAVRSYASTLSEQDVGWLRGLRDPYVGRALALIHRNLDTVWSAESLAREVALSRSAFVHRFSSLVGAPPIRYLTACRMQAARLSLRETPRSVAQIAHTVGYESEEAFSRAFKREFGLSPARWRDVERGADGSSRNANGGAPRRRRQSEFA